MAKPNASFSFLGTAAIVVVLLAILILTQTLLPLCGALIVGTWLYLFRWGPLVAIDALPVVTASATTTFPAGTPDPR